MNNKNVIMRSHSEAIYIWPMILISFGCYLAVRIDPLNNLYEVGNLASAVYLVFFALTLMTALVKIEEILTLAVMGMALIAVLYVNFHMPEVIFREVLPILDIRTLNMTQNIYAISGLFFLFVFLVALGIDGVEKIEVAGSRVCIRMWNGEEKITELSSLVIRVRPKDFLRSLLGLGALDLDVTITQGVMQETYTLRNVVNARYKIKQIEMLRDQYRGY